MHALSRSLAGVGLLILLLSPSFAFAAIARDNVSNNYSGSQTGTYSVSIVINSGVNELLICQAIGTSVASTGMTDNGTAMTLAGTNPDGGNNQYLYYHLGDSSGTHTIVDSFTGGPTDIQLPCQAWSGVKQTGFPDASNFTNSGTANLTTTLTVSANAWMFSTGRNTSSGPMTAGTGVTDQSSGTRYFSFGDSNGPLTAGSQSQTWTASSGSSYTMAVSFVPAGAAISSSFGYFNSFWW